MPPEWEATEARPGVNFVADLTTRSVERIKAQIARHRRHGDLVVASIHWGPNWGYDISDRQVSFAHALIEDAGVDLIHGHSSHHPKGIEVFRDKLILYGCGDFIDDYEGIRGYEEYRGDLGLMYFARLDTGSGRLEGLEMFPTQLRRLQVTQASPKDSKWLQDTLNREGRRYGTRIERRADGAWVLASN